MSMADIPSIAVHSPVPSVFVSFAHADANQVRPIVEAMRANGLHVLALSEADPLLWGQEIKSFVESVFPQQYSVAVVFLSKNFEDSFFSHRELETLVHRAGPDMQQGLIVPARLDDTPPPVPISRLASLDIRAFQPHEFAAQVGKAIAEWQDVRAANPVEYTDEQMLARYRETGESAIVQEMWDRLYPKITSWVRSRWGNEVDPNDVTQRTFTVLWPRLRDPLPIGLSFRSYAFSTANRIATALIREHRKDPSLLLDENVSNRLDSDPSAEVERRELISHLHAAIANLPAIEREVVELVVNNGNMIGQAATKLGIPYTIVMDHYRTAMAKLRRQLSDAIRA
jgi:RNA polymerase sigma-70 factor (ECF subfamily)